MGTKERTRIGICECNPGYIYDQCDLCSEDYHRNGNKCDPEACHEIGTIKRDKVGNCDCKIQFKGARCDKCSQGYKGVDCNQCKTGYHKEEGLCLPGKCDTKGT